MLFRSTVEGKLNDNEDISFTNSWNVWVYPKEVNLNTGEIYVCDTLNSEALDILENGGRVLLCADGKISYGKDVVQQFLPVFWNTSWFKMRPPHTTGLYIQETHPLFKNFPTDYYSDLQWWELVNRRQVMLFNEFPADFQPIVQSIDTRYLSRKIGMLYEANVLKGKLMMTTLPVRGNLRDDASPYAEMPVSRQMMHALLAYMNSDEFEPQFTLSPTLIRNLYTKEAPAVNMFTKDAPDELKVKVNKPQ